MAILLAQCGEKAGIKWKHNALRHSYISYRVAELKAVDQVALESGNSPDMIFKHYRELVSGKQGAEWFGITPEKVEEFKKAEEAKRKEKVVPMAVAA